MSKSLGCKSLFFKSQPELVLASTSIYRRRLLERLHVAFTTAAPGVDETRGGAETPHGLATRLARQKAARIAAGRPQAWVIGSDQVAVLANGTEPARVLGKPGTASRCALQLQECSGHTVAFLTAVAVLRAEDAAQFEFLDTTHVRFRSLDDGTIARYVERESPLDCAGGFKSEGLGIALCDAIDSADPTALIGLPLIRLAAVLRQIGFQVP